MFRWARFKPSKMIMISWSFFTHFQTAWLNTWMGVKFVRCSFFGQVRSRLAITWEVFMKKKIRATIYFFLQLCFHETRLYDVMMQFNVVKCIATASSESAIKTNLWMFTMDVSIYIYPFKSKAYRANLQLMWCYYRHRTLAFPLDLCCCFQIR